jgi:hypothetical protein
VSVTASRGRRSRWLARIAVLGLLDLVLLLLALQSLRVDAQVADERVVVGVWEPLDGRAWTSAITGFRGPGQPDLPLVDSAYGGGPITLGDRVFEDGLSLYPYAEVVYRLDDGFGLFQAVVGTRPREWVPEGAARFLVYGDGALLHDSGPLRSDAGPREVGVGLAGVHELRLVATTVDDAPPAYTYLGEPRLLRPLVAAPAPRPPGREAVLLAAREQNQRQRRLAEIEALGASRAAAVRRWRFEHGGPDAIVGGRLPDGALALASREVAAVFEPGQAGPLSVLDLVHGRLLGADLNPRLTLPDDTTYALSALAPEGAAAHSVGRTTDPALGSGQTLRVPLAAPDGRLRATLALCLYAGSNALIVQLEADRAVESFALLSGADGGLALGAGLRYVTDFSRPREARVRADGLERPELVGLGAPVFLWSERPEAGLVVAALDETELPPRFGVRRERGGVLARVTFETGPVAPRGVADPTRSPRLYLEATGTSDPRAALAPFRALSVAMHPPPPLPGWVRHQWGSWYVFGTNVDEWKIREFVDYLADHLGDVGPWHILLDAGWFIAEGRPGAELAVVDEEKFPSGIRAVVDHAHSRGIRVILYYSAPYVDTRPVVSEWLALPGFIERHHEWLIPLGASGGQESYVYDFANPALRRYMTRVLTRYYEEWNADGILIDMLGHTEGAVLNLARPDRFGVVRQALGQSMAIYRLLWDESLRLRPDAFLEGAWDTPLLGRPYAHTWRYADDTPTYSAAYPFPGLVEHIDYAILQHLMLGQRPHMGAVIGQPDARINYAWLGAGLALGSQVVLSLPFTIVSPADLDEYRAYLTMAQPFAGETHVGAGFHPDTFATTVDGTTFLGVLNRERVGRDIPVDLEELGLRGDAEYVAYDVEQASGARVRAGFVASLPAETFRLYVLRRDPGVLWTSSSFEELGGRDCLHVRLGGPERVPGYLKAYTPPPSAVYLDGQPLAERAGGAEGYVYDAARGLLALHYPHAAARELRVAC